MSLSGSQLEVILRMASHGCVLERHGAYWCTPGTQTKAFAQVLGKQTAIPEWHAQSRTVRSLLAKGLI